MTVGANLLCFYSERNPGILLTFVAATNGFRRYHPGDGHFDWAMDGRPGAMAPLVPVMEKVNAQRRDAGASAPFVELRVVHGGPK